MTKTRIRNSSLVAVCGLIPALFLTACNPSGGGSTTQVSPPRATAASGAAGTKAPQGTGNGAKLAAAIALSPEEWSKGFEKDDPYEDASLDYTVTNASCKGELGQAPASLSGSMTRNVKVPTPGVSDGSVSNLGWTSVTVFGNVADAQKDYADGTASVKRCPSWSNDDGSTKETNSHEVAAPAIPLADAVFAEEGEVQYANDKGGTLPYYALTARKGTVTLTAYLDGTEGSSTAQLHVQVQGALTAMLMKLKTQGQ